jgi:Kef-type K+ transport system membrane component KefB
MGEEGDFITSRLLEQATGITSGAVPLENATELYLVQIILIVTLGQTMGSIFARYNQPRVIAEIISGILLGPTFLGQIPGFTDRLFPVDNLPALKLTATLGLVLFLFIVGMELDPSVLKMNAKRSFCISAGGEIFAWCWAILLAYLMYNNIDGLNKSFPIFLLFIGVAMSVTAFPVLSRILIEGRLLSTEVGTATIGSAAFDDIMAWSMLALIVSLVNAGAPQQAAYVFLLMISFVILMLTIGRAIAIRIVRRFDAFHKVNRTIVCIALLCALSSGWFTQMIGVDAIFGGFLVGLIIPRDGTLTIELTEKVEDVVTVLLLPLYFTVSGLKTDFLALNTGKSWGFVCLVILGACVGKIVGCGTAAKLSGLKNREALTVGILMNTRGLVELIILNVGLDADVINREVFAIMVLMAIVTTFMTAPIANIIYPMHLRVPASAYNKIEAAKGEEVQKKSLFEIASHLNNYKSLDVFAQQMLKEIKLLVCLPGHGVRALASSMAAVQLLRREGADLHAVRVLELSDRFSSDMAATNVNRTLTGDSVMGAFCSFCGGGVHLTAHMVLAAAADLPSDVLALAQRLNINTVMIGWEPPQQSKWSRSEDSLSPAQVLMEGLFVQSALHGISVAVAVDKGALSQAVSTILVPIASFSHCEMEALLLAMSMSIQSKAEVVVMVLGINGIEGAVEEPVIPASAVIASAHDDPNKFNEKDVSRSFTEETFVEVHQNGVRNWLNGNSKKAENDSSGERTLLQIEDIEQQVASGKTILAAASNLGAQIIHVPSELTPRSQIEALLKRMHASNKTIAAPLAVGGPTEAPHFPLVVCGRHSCFTGGADNSILGLLGGEVYEAFPSTSLVVVHSSTGAALHHQEADAINAAGGHNNFFERNLLKSQFRHSDTNRHTPIDAASNV